MPVVAPPTTAIVAQQNELKDFFNGIVAVSVVVLFAKFVTHRSRKKNPPQIKFLGRTVKFLGRTGSDWSHLACVTLAGAGVFLGLYGAQFAQHQGIRYWAWITTSLALLILTIDVVGNDFRASKDRSSATSQGSRPTPADPPAPPVTGRTPPDRPGDPPSTQQMSDDA
jgi:hypothetical protein